MYLGCFPAMYSSRSLRSWSSGTARDSTDSCSTLSAPASMRSSASCTGWGGCRGCREHRTCGKGNCFALGTLADMHNEAYITGRMQEVDTEGSDGGRAWPRPHQRRNGARCQPVGRNAAGRGAPGTLLPPLPLLPTLISSKGLRMPDSSIRMLCARRCSTSRTCTGGPVGEGGRGRLGRQAGQAKAHMCQQMGHTLLDCRSRHVQVPPGQRACRRAAGKHAAAPGRHFHQPYLVILGGAALNGLGLHDLL